MTQRHSRKGFTLIYHLILLIVVCAFASLGVDVARVQTAKTELRRCADAAALAAASSLSSGTSAAEDAAVTYASLNAVGEQSQPLNRTNDIQFGLWNGKSFTVLTGSTRGNANAVRVFARRTTASGNAIPLSFGPIIGQNTCNVQASSIALRTTTGFGFVGLNSATFSGGAWTDSYDSSAGDYPTGLGSHGDVSSNGTFNLSGSGTIHGSVIMGPGSSVKTSGSGTITGSSTTLGAAISFPDFDATPYESNNNNASIPAAYVKNGKFSLSGSEFVDFPAGTYYFDEFTMSGQSKIRITGPVTLVVRGKVNLSGQVITLNNFPGNFKVNVASSESVTVSGSAALYAEVYAPQSDATVSGGGGLFGGIIANSLNVSGTGGLHRDFGQGSHSICLVQ